MTAPESLRHPFDARPLTEPVDPRAVSAWIRAMREKRPTSSATTVIAVIVVVVAVAVMLPMFAGVLIFISSVAFTGHGAISALALLPVLLILLIFAGIVTLLITRMRSGRVRRYRIARFATANGMVYDDGIPDPALPGMIFQLGANRQSSMLVRGFQPRFVEFGNYSYTTSSGKEQVTHSWGYVAVRLDVPLPNIVLDALGNNSLGTNLPSSFSRDQRLSLEGDFDRHFTLYCPRGYEQDALYLFTPDIMARFIDHAAQLDVEIVDDWLFLYMQRPASTTDPATWAWLFSAVGALLTKFDQWARWRDERLRAPAGPPEAIPQVRQPMSALPFAAPAGMLTPPPGVAAPGRRLRRRVPVVAIVVIVGALVLALVPAVVLPLVFALR